MKRYTQEQRLPLDEDPEGIWVKYHISQNEIDALEIEKAALLGTLKFKADEIAALRWWIKGDRGVENPDLTGYKTP